VKYLYSRRAFTQIVVLLFNILVLITALLHADNIGLCIFNERNESTKAILKNIVITEYIV